MSSTPLPSFGLLLVVAVARLPDAMAAGGLAAPVAAAVMGLTLSLLSPPRAADGPPEIGREAIRRWLPAALLGTSAARFGPVAVGVAVAVTAALPALLSTGRARRLWTGLWAAAALLLAWLAVPEADAAGPLTWTLAEPAWGRVDRWIGDAVVLALGLAGAWTPPVDRGVHLRRLSLDVLVLGAVALACAAWWEAGMVAATAWAGACAGLAAAPRADARPSGGWVDGALVAWFGTVGAAGAGWWWASLLPLLTAAALAGDAWRAPAHRPVIGAVAAACAAVGLWAFPGLPADPWDAAAASATVVALVWWLGWRLA